MTTNQEALYRLGCIGLGIFLVAFIATASLGVVWLRQDTSRAAYNIKTLEQELSIIERDNQYLKSKIAEVESPERLKRTFEGKMFAPQNEQVVWIHPGNRPQTVNPQHRKPFAVAYDLAFIEPSSVQ